MFEGTIVESKEKNNNKVPVIRRKDKVGIHREYEIIKTRRKVRKRKKNLQKDRRKNIKKNEYTKEMKAKLKNQKQTKRKEKNIWGMLNRV